MKKLKNLRKDADISFSKNTKNIKICCHVFFEYVNSQLRSELPEYQEANIHDKNGIIFCPDCVIKNLRQ